jgi:23S rRNA-intervening sequence protein
MGDYRELLAWQRARELVKAVYRATDRFLIPEHFGLAAQPPRTPAA